MEIVAFTLSKFYRPVKSLIVMGWSLTSNNAAREDGRALNRILLGKLCVNNGNSRADCYKAILGHPHAPGMLTFNIFFQYYSKVLMLHEFFSSLPKNVFVSWHSYNKQIHNSSFLVYCAGL